MRPFGALRRTLEDSRYLKLPVLRNKLCYVPELVHALPVFVVPGQL